MLIYTQNLLLPCSKNISHPWKNKKGKRVLCEVSHKNVWQNVANIIVCTHVLYITSCLSYISPKNLVAVYNLDVLFYSYFYLKEFIFCMYLSEKARTSIQLLRKWYEMLSSFAKKTCEIFHLDYVGLVCYQKYVFSSISFSKKKGKCVWHDGGSRF